MLPPLAPDQTVKPNRFELRVALLYVCLFIPNGIHLPYFPLWLEANGFGPEKIAVILSAPMFLRVATTPLLTALADKVRDRADVYIALVAASVLVSAGYFLTPDYVVVLAVSLVLAVVWTPHSTIADSLALSGVRRFGSNYPAMRIWGSISFLCANLAGGLILAHTGAGAVPGVLFLSFCAALAAALFTPRLGRPRLASPLSAADMQDQAPKLLEPYFLYFVTGAGVIQPGELQACRPSLGPALQRRHLPVVEFGRPLGIVSVRDALDEDLLDLRWDLEQREVARE